MPISRSSELQPGESATARSQPLVAPATGLLVVGQEQVISHTPELARLFPVLLQVRPALADLPPVLQEIIRDAQASGKSASARELPLPARGTVLHLSALSLAAGPTPRVVLAVAERAPTTPQLDSLRRLDRLASLGTLSASMAHEVRNAFVAVKTFIDLLLEQDASNELTGLVRREMSRIDSLVAQMLRFAAPAGTGRKHVALHRTIEHTLRMLTPNFEARAITLRKDLAAQPDTIAGDDYQLEQAILNLLLNAVEAMGSEGTLTVATATLGAGDPGSVGTAFAAQPCVLLRVTDTGPGMPTESQRHLFEPFFTTKANGTGLGLAITQRIVKEHDGLISLTSEPGRGCAFTLLFPVPPVAG